jgi:hypothetical protein
MPSSGQARKDYLNASNSVVKAIVASVYEGRAGKSLSIIQKEKTMSHHSSELRDKMLHTALREGLGATGFFPGGKIDRLDEGQLKFAIAADHATNTVLINFGKPIAWLGMTADEALSIANSLRDKAIEIKTKVKQP